MVADAGLMVRVGGVDFVGATRPDDWRKGAFLITRAGLDGWEDGVDVRQQAVEYSMSNGSYDLAPRLASRVVQVTGKALAPDPVTLGWMRSKLSGLGARGEQMSVEVTMNGCTSWARCRLGAKPQFTDTGRRSGVCEGDFVVQLWCPDPRKFGERKVFSGRSVQVFHRGNFDASPTIQVRGALSGGYTVSSSDGRTFRVTEALTSSQVHTINTSTGVLRVDGSAVFGSVTSADLLKVAPGTTPTFTVTSGATLTVPVYDTFI
ncbi:hypothetical protein D9V30_00055 [Mycetocola reblochoni]|uniref:Uncharacterized protein n=1 Tax=Mycetocola reblochoni TaxID=331618 RepID=A0A3L6ZSE0_9MICO|nr:hypothetical protein [Mycetocola reblochoni]RLP70866.1 hypothetical protein D9V30_00055 [Mycetocola reblochoni]